MPRLRMIWQSVECVTVVMIVTRSGAADTNHP